MNSTSDIVDELNLIKNTSNSTTTKKGPKTIDDIIESNIKDIENVLDSRVVNIYARPWNKLEPKLISIETHNVDGSESENTRYINDFLKEKDFDILKRVGPSTLFKGNR